MDRANFLRQLIGFSVLLIFLSFLIYKSATQFIAIEVTEFKITLRKPVLLFINKSNSKAFIEISIQEIKEIEIRRIINNSKLILHSKTNQELFSEVFSPQFYFFTDLEKFLKQKNIPIRIRRTN